MSGRTASTSARTKQGGAAKAKTPAVKSTAKPSMKLVGKDQAVKRERATVTRTAVPKAVKRSDLNDASSVAVLDEPLPRSVPAAFRSGNGTGAAVALQRSPEPAAIEFDDAFDDELESDLDEDSGDTAGLSRTLLPTNPFEGPSAGFEYDPTADMTPEQRRAMRDQVVVEHLPLVRAIAVRVHENLPVHVELDDLVHAGIMGLFDASGTFNNRTRL